MYHAPSTRPYRAENDLQDFEVCISVQAVVNDTESGILVDNNLMIGIVPAQS